MNFKRNVAANAISQIYASLIGIFILPLYLKCMGAEIYGLIAFYTMLQAWFVVLDLGISPTISRETARFNAGAVTTLNYRNLMKAVQIVFLFMAILIASSFFFLSDYIANSWLKINTLSSLQVVSSLKLMGICIALRWMLSLYRAMISGSERFVWLSTYTIFFTSFRYIFVLLIFAYVSATPLAFFSYQCLIAAIELFVIIQKAFKGFPKLAKNELLFTSWKGLYRSIQPIFSISMLIAASTAIWIFMSQTDKLILSKLLPLKEYGYFMLAVLAASGVNLLCTPVGSALMPRMTKLKAEKNEDAFLAIYHYATQLTALIALPIACVLYFFAEQILWIWIKDYYVAHLIAPIFKYYVIGNTLLIFTALTYYLQYAHGKLFFHLSGNIFFLCLFIPSTIWATLHFGMEGAAMVWLGANLIWFFFWAPLIHHLFCKGVHLSWVLQDIGKILVYAFIPAIVLHRVIALTGSSFEMSLKLVFIYFTILSIACLGNTQLRAFIKGYFFSIRLFQKQIKDRV